MKADFQAVQLYAKQKGIDFETAAKEMGLTPQEAEALQALGGDPGKNEDGFVSLRKTEVKDPEPKKEEKSFFSKLGVAAAVVAGCTVVGAAIGGVAGFFGGAGVGAVPGAAGGAKAGAVLGGLLVGATSCSTDISQNVGITVTSKNSNEEIIEALQEFSNNIIGAIYELKNSIGVGMDRIITILQGLGFQLDKIYETLLDQGTKADEILKELQKNTADQNAKLDALSKGQEEIKELLIKILDAMNEGNQIGQKNNELLTEVLKALGDIKANDATGIELLEKILAKVTEGVEQNKDMDSKTHELLNEVISKIGQLDETSKALVATIIDKLDELGKNATPMLQSILENIQNFNGDNKTLLQEVIAKIETFDTKTQEALQVIIAALGTLGADANDYLSEILNSVNAGNEINVGNQDLLKLIVDKMEEFKNDNNAANKDANALLKAILEQVVSSTVQNKEMDTKTHDLLEHVIEAIKNMDASTQIGLANVLEAINKLGENGNKYLDDILQAVKDGNLTALQNNEVLKVISDKIDGLNPVDNKESIELLKQILAKIVELSAQEKAMDKDTQALIKDLINSFNKFDVNTQQALAVIIEKMDKLGENGQEALEKVLNAIKENTEVAKGTQELVRALLDKVDKLGDKADTIIEVISKIGVGESVDLTKIEEMLAELLKQEKANQKIFTDINSKLNLVAVTLQGLAPQIDANNKAVLAKLQEILNKIPEGCNCTHESVDITVIVEKLDKIIEEIKKDPKNEGILGDLGNLENLLG